MAFYTNPSLTLTFLGNDIEPGHHKTQTVTDADIVFRSIAFKGQLLSGLKSASNQVTLQLLSSCVSIEDIIATDGDIQAVLKNGNTVLFTGYLSTNYSWSVTDSGKQALNITLEDTGTRLLGKTFLETGHHLFDCSVYNAVCAVCDRAGITVSEDCIKAEETVTRVVDSSVTCQDILGTMLYETGYVYYFDEHGELLLYKIQCDIPEDIPVIDRTSLVCAGDKAITLSKKIRTYRSARVSFTSLEKADDYLIYRNTTGADESHPYCKFELNGKEYFDGLEVYTEQQWHEETLDEFREDALVEACNAASETDLVGSGKIIAISNVRPVIVKDDAITSSIEAAGGSYIKILVHNTSSSKKTVNRLDAYASVVYERADNVIRTSDSALTGDDSDTRLDEKMEYIHDRTLVQSHANLISQYHRYCNSQYTFSSSEDLEMGSVVKLHDNVFSGLEVNVLITGKNYSDGNGYYQYTSVGITVFDISKDVYRRTSGKGKQNSVNGKNGLSAFEIAVQHGYTGTEEEWLESLKGEDGEQGPQGEPGEKGEDGEDGPSAKPVYQYALVNDGITPEDEDFHETIPQGWVYGKLYWIRIRYIWSDGKPDSYSEPYVDESTNKDLIESCIFNITCDCTNYHIDRRSTESQTVTFTAEQKGYDAQSYSWLITGDSDVKTGQSVSIPVAKSSAPEEMTAVCTMTYIYAGEVKTLVKTFVLSSEDSTEYFKCYGIVTSAPASAIEGDCYIKEEEGNYYPYVLYEGEWIQVEDFAQFSEQAAKIRDTLIAQNINVPVTSKAIYGYFRNLSVQSANIDCISSSDINLKSGGHVHSDGYQQGTVKKLIDGELDPETTKKGFFMDSEGNAEFFKADIYKANINEGVLNNVTVNGKLNSATLVTQVNDALGENYRNRDITLGDKYWSESEVSDVVKRAVPHNSVIDCTGRFADKSFTKTIFVDDNTTSTDVGFQVAWTTPADVRVTASGGTNLYVNGSNVFPVNVGYKKGAFVLDYLGGSGGLPGYSSTHHFYIGYTNGKYYIAMPEYVDIFSSTDGLNFTLVAEDISKMACSTTSNWEKMFTCGNGRLLLVTFNKGLFVSSDGGKNWTDQTNFSQVVWDRSVNPYQGVSVVFCNNMFYAILEGSYDVFSSPDGITWKFAFSSPYALCYAMVYVNGKYTLFSFNKYNGLGGILSMTSTDFKRWDPVVADTPIMQLVDATVTSDGTYVLVGYGETGGYGVSFSRDLEHWSPITNPGNSFYMAGLATNGTDIVSANCYDASRVSLKFRFGGNLSYKLNYQKGLHYIGSDNTVFASLTDAWRKDTSYLTYNGTRLYYNSNEIVETPSVGYTYRGMEKKTGSVWEEIASGEFFRFSQLSITYTPVGSSRKTVNDIQGITWTSSLLTIARLNAPPVVFDDKIILADFTLSFTPVAMSKGNYTDALYPMEEGKDIGLIDIPYQNVYCENFIASDQASAKELHISDTINLGGKELLSLIFDRIYPVGCVYISLDAKDPKLLFGGVWEMLPSGFALWTSSSGAGGTIDAGLPNITGTFASFAYWYSTIFAQPTGAFSMNGTKIGRDYDGDSGSTAAVFDFDASKSSNVYGKSETVQPPAIKIYAWKRVS